MPSRTTDTFPERAGKFVMGGSHIGTGGDRYLMANRPSEGSRATRRALDDPSRDNIVRYLRVHIDDESLVTDELVDYIHRAHSWSPEFIEACRQSVSLPHDSPASRYLRGLLKLTVIGYAQAWARVRWEQNRWRACGRRGGARSGPAHWAAAWLVSGSSD
jgi:hypothetical protein